MDASYAPFLAHIPEGGNILDAGCGSGRDSLYFLRQDYRVTAFDASEELVKLSARLTDLPVLKLTFLELEFASEFDGIWACASLLHIPRTEFDNALIRMTRGMKPNGVLYASFKYGDGEYERDGRFFNSYNEESFLALVKRHHKLKVLQTWKSEDVRRGRNKEFWLNVLLKKVN